MKQYKDLVYRVLTEGVKREDRTGTGTVSIFGHQMRFDLRNGFPLLTTKRMPFKAIKTELEWFLSGDTNIKYLSEKGVHIWDEWADENGDLGPIYGKQWRSWDRGNGETIDQIQQVIDEIKKNPNSRRLVVSAWNVADIPKMALPPCHTLFQFYVHEGRLSCQLYQRSADVGLGVPFNIASYSLLTHMIAKQCGLDAGEFVWTGGDCHIYLNHVDALSGQLVRTPLPLPLLNDDFELENYVSYDAIKMPISV